MSRLPPIVTLALWLAVWSALPALGQRPPDMGGGAPGARCSISATTHVSFGAYHPLSPAALDTMGSVSLRCVGGGPLPAVMLQFGRGGGGGFLPRSMVSGSNQLEYNLFLDAGRTAIWGDGTSGTSTFTAQAVRGRAITVPIFARIPPGQRVPPGRYADSIVMTLLY